MADQSAIADHGLIGDLRTAALVDVAGTVDWLCLPRFDSPSVFGSLLDPGAGHWTIAPTCALSGTHQFYFPDSNVLVTRFLTEDGVVEVQDFMPVAEDEADRCLIRRVECVRGAMELETEIAPRPDYGLETPVPELDGDAVALGELRLRASVTLTLGEGAVTSVFALESGDIATFALHPGAGGPVDAAAAFEATVRYWRDWLEGSSYAGRWREMVLRSALTLKLLTYRPTGAIVAAPTTSLPEHIGGERNWDYRCVWPRDAAFSAYALVALGFTEELRDFVGWITDRLRDAGEDESGPLRVLYDLDGSPDVTERELDHLAGYRGSRPVRVGNDASGQLQLDIYGEVVDSVYLSDKYGEPVSATRGRTAAHRRLGLRPLGLRGRGHLGDAPGPPPSHLLAADVLGGDRARRAHGAPARAAGRPLAPDADPRRHLRADHGPGLQHRARRVRPALRDGRPRRLAAADADGQVHRADRPPLPLDPRRHRGGARVGHARVPLRPRAAPDGLDGAEGTLSICSFWYVEALTRAGRLEDARLALEKMFTYGNHLGLYAEQIGLTGEQLGNFPQAFTHLALISAAINLDRALSAAA